MYLDENGLPRVTLKIKTYLNQKLVSKKVVLTSNSDCLLTSNNEYICFTESSQQS